MLYTVWICGEQIQYVYILAFIFFNGKVKQVTLHREWHLRMSLAVLWFSVFVETDVKKHKNVTRKKCLKLHALYFQQRANVASTAKVLLKQNVK